VDPSIVADTPPALAPTVLPVPADAVAVGGDGGSCRVELPVDALLTLEPVECVELLLEEPPQPAPASAVGASATVAMAAVTRRHRRGLQDEQAGTFSPGALPCEQMARCCSSRPAPPSVGAACPRQ
jgi:hypothetical protein